MLKLKKEKRKKMREETSTQVMEHGDTLGLQKNDGDDITSFYVGANWGVIEKKKMFGGTEKIPVDLDLSALVFDKEGRNTAIVYFGNLIEKGIIHVGDDIGGDTDGDDHLDNESIEIKMDELREDTHQIMFVLNAYEKEGEHGEQPDLTEVPFASIRLYEGRPSEATKIVATYNISNKPEFKGCRAMILGKLSQEGGGWNFTAIGEVTKDKDFTQTISTVKSSFLSWETE